MGERTCARACVLCVTDLRCVCAHQVHCAQYRRYSYPFYHKTGPVSLLLEGKPLIREVVGSSKIISIVTIVIFIIIIIS